MRSTPPAPWIARPALVWLALVGLALVGASACAPSWPVGLALPEPVQADLPPDAPRTFQWREHAFRPLHAYRLRALVLSKMSYRFDRMAEVSSVDLALGWGVMSDARVVDALRIRQNDRYYFWGFQGAPPAPVDEIVKSSANVHLVTGVKGTAEVIDDVRAGDVVELEGALVQITGRDGWETTSSTTRTDKGGGACEVLWVDRARVVPRAELP